MQLYKPQPSVAYSVSRQAGKLTCGYPVAMVLISSSYLLKPSATDTAQATVHPTIGLLPIPMNPIIST